jgi:ribose transport system ATP-binding protein
MLEVRDVSKVFGGTVALSHASLEVRAGEIHALLGENGAGKSTLIKILAGVHSPDAGEILIDGAQLEPGHTPPDAKAAGLAFIHQDFGLVGDMSVAENIALLDGYPVRRGIIDWRATRRACRAILEPLGVQLPPDRIIDELPVGSRAIVAIARAIAARATVLVLDEPTASLAAGEVAALFRILRNLRDSGVACVFVSHRMDEVNELCDRATVLRNGRTIGTVGVAEVSRDEVVRMIVGHSVPSRRPASTSVTERVRLEGRNVDAGILVDFSFKAHAGEILGVTGLADSGAADIGSALIGRVPLARGELSVDGRPFTPSTPGAATREGIAYTPADRAAEGLAMSMTLRENLNPNPPSGSWLRRRRGHETVEARRALRRYDVRPPDPERETSTLSGGNAQKLMLARWLTVQPGILILNEPTTGIDVGAREQIYRFLREAAAGGATCLVITSDFNEVAQVCDRALVLYRGRISRELSGRDVDTSAVTAAAVGHMDTT